MEGEAHPVWRESLANHNRWKNVSFSKQGLMRILICIDVICSIYMVATSIRCKLPLDIAMFPTSPKTLGSFRESCGIPSFYGFTGTFYGDRQLINMSPSHIQAHLPYHTVHLHTFRLSSVS